MVTLSLEVPTEFKNLPGSTVQQIKENTDADYQRSGCQLHCAWREWQIDMLACQGCSQKEMLVSGSSGLRFAVGMELCPEGALKLPTPLERKTLPTWLEMTEEQQGIKTAKETLTSKMMPVVFVLLDEVHHCTLQPGKAWAVFVHNMKKLLGEAMAELGVEVCRPLGAAPVSGQIVWLISQQLRMMGTSKTLQAAVECARLLMAVDNQGRVTYRQA